MFGTTKPKAKQKIPRTMFGAEVSPRDAPLATPGLPVGQKQGLPGSVVQPEPPKQKQDLPSPAVQPSPKQKQDLPSPAVQPEPPNRSKTFLAQPFSRSPQTEARPSWPLRSAGDFPAGDSFYPRGIRPGETPVGGSFYPQGIRPSGEGAAPGSRQPRRESAPEAGQPGPRPTPEPAPGTGQPGPGAEGADPDKPGWRQRVNDSYSRVMGMDTASAAAAAAGGFRAAADNVGGWAADARVGLEAGLRGVSPEALRNLESVRSRAQELDRLSRQIAAFEKPGVLTKGRRKKTSSA